MNIVVRGANWIGDAVMTIPALRRLREIQPKDKITLLTRPWAEGVFRDADFIDEIMTIDPARSKLASVREQVRQLRSGNFNKAILFPNSFESSLVVRFANIPFRSGYATEKRGFLLTEGKVVPEWKDEVHQSNYYLNLIEPIDKVFPGLSKDTPLPVSNERKEHAQLTLRKLTGSSNGQIVGFGAGSTNSHAKRWPVSHFAELADHLTRGLNASIVLMGAADEINVSEAVISAASGEIFDLTGKTGLDEATAILSVLDLFVSNDMGLAHIAAAVGTPTIVIFGPTNDEATRPLGKNVLIIREPVECSPCMLRVCPIDHRCMTRVRPERVFESAVGMLETRIR